MNPAIFKFTFFQKFRGPLDWLILAGLLLGPAATTLIYGLNMEDVRYREYMVSKNFEAFEQLTYLMLLAFVFVSDGLVGRRIIGESAPLSLVFSRPITRISYVFSKWVAGSLGVICILLPAAFLFQLASYILGVKILHTDGYAIATMILNSMGYVALMVFLHSLPGVIGPITYLSTFSITNVGNQLAQASDKDIAWYALILKRIAVQLSFWLGDFTFPTIDVFTLLTSVVFDWTTVIVYISTIVIFLVSAALIMARREFFYATE